MSEYACPPKLFGSEAIGNMAFIYRTSYVCMPSGWLCWVQSTCLSRPCLHRFSPCFVPQEPGSVATISGYSALWLLVVFGHRSTSAGDQRKRGEYIRAFIPSAASLQSPHGLEPRATVSTQLSFSLSAFFFSSVGNHSFPFPFQT